jgi:acetylornithine deacetylase/succinyl-diaminopimelate desuccinylase-like protein
VKVLPLVQKYYPQTTEIDHGPRELLDLRSSMRDPVFAKQFLLLPVQNASVRDTITPTVLSGSNKTNVIPSSASAELDCRLLPGDDPAAMIKTINRLTADDRIKVDPILNFPARSSPEKTPLMAAIRTLAARHDQAEVVSTLQIGFTDCHYFRDLGLIAYGFIPIEARPEESRTIHGVNERIAIANLRGGIERMVDLLKILGGR